MHPSDNVNQRQNINNNQPNNNGTSQNVVNNLHRPNPSLMRINIDDQDKQKICIFWTILIVFILLIAILSAFAIPKVFIPNDMAKSLQSTNLKNCINPNQVINSTVFCDTNNTRAFGQLLTRWNQYNQFITVYLQIKPNNLSNRIIINQQYTFQLYEASIGATDKMIKVDDKEVLNAIISFDSDSALKLYAEDDKTVVGYIHLYVIITRLSGKALYIKTNFSTTANFNNIKLKMQSYAVNQKFTGFTITLRYIFFFTSIITAFLYIKRYLIIPQQKKIIQQKFIFIASILLIMFNDPFYIITILKPNGVRYFLQYKSAFFSIMVIMNLIAFLLLFWIVVLKRIHLQDGVVDSQPVTKGPIAYAIVVWTLLVIVNMTYAMQQIDKHPIISNNFSRQYQAALIFVGLVIFLGVFWIVVYYIKIFLETESKLWRSNIFMSLSIFVIIILFVLIVTNSLSIYNYKGSSILFVYCLVNMYIYYLQFMFSITLQQIQKIENPQLQDQINFIQMASVGTINIVDVNLSDYNPQDKRQYNLQQKQNEIYFKNPNLIQPPKLHQLEEQNQEVQTQNIAKQNDKDQIDSFGFD